MPFEMILNAISTDETDGLTQIRDDYYIKFSPEYTAASAIKIAAFSTKDFPVSPKVARKYLGQVSSRAYYPDGRKKWFYSFMFKYEFFIPKELLILDREKSRLSYIEWGLDGIRIVNSTTGGSGNGKWVDHQGASIHHCMDLKEKEFKVLSEHAVVNEKTEMQAERPFGTDINLRMILFLEKYANGRTNFSKALKSYSKFLANGLHPLVEDILRTGDLREETRAAWTWNSVEEGQDKEAAAIIADWDRWSELCGPRKELFTIPVEVLKAYRRLRRWK